MQVLLRKLPTAFHQLLRKSPTAVLQGLLQPVFLHTSVHPQTPSQFRDPLHFSLSSSNGEVDESSFENLSSIGGCFFSFIVSDKVDVSSGDREAKEAGRKNLVKRKRPRDAQSERTVTCTDCGVQLHWASLAQHRKKHHVKESGTSNTEGGYEQIVRLFYDLTWCPQV